MKNNKNLNEACKIFQELMDGYLFHTNKMNEEGKVCFKYFYTIIKGDYNLNDTVIEYIKEIGYENDLDITCNLKYSYSLASFTVKSLRKQVKTLKKE